MRSSRRFRLKLTDLGKLVLASAALLFIPADARAQSLNSIAQTARNSWLNQDMRSFLAAGDPVEVRLPGARPSRALPASQAAALLRDFVDGATEQAFDISTVRDAGNGRGYVEATRRFLVRGTSNEQSQTVFMTFRQSGDRWILREVRIS